MKPYQQNLNVTTKHKKNQPNAHFKAMTQRKMHFPTVKPKPFVFEPETFIDEEKLAKIIVFSRNFQSLNLCIEDEKIFYPSATISQKKILWIFFGLLMLTSEVASSEIQCDNGVKPLYFPEYDLKLPFLGHFFNSPGFFEANGKVNFTTFGDNEALQKKNLAFSKELETLLIQLYHGLSDKEQHIKVKKNLRKLNTQIKNSGIALEPDARLTLLTYKFAAQAIQDPIPLFNTIVHDASLNEALAMTLLENSIKFGYTNNVQTTLGHLLQANSKATWKIIHHYLKTLYEERLRAAKKQITRDQLSSVDYLITRINENIEILSIISKEEKYYFDKAIGVRTFVFLIAEADLKVAYDKLNNYRTALGNIKSQQIDALTVVLGFALTGLPPYANDQTLKQNITTSLKTLHNDINQGLNSDSIEAFQNTIRRIESVTAELERVESKNKDMNSEYFKNGIFKIFTRETYTSLHDKISQIKSVTKKNKKALMADCQYASDLLQEAITRLPLVEDNKNYFILLSALVFRYRTLLGEEADLKYLLIAIVKKFGRAYPNFLQQIVDVMNDSYNYKMQFDGVQLQKFTLSIAIENHARWIVGMPQYTLENYLKSGFSNEEVPVDRRLLIWSIFAVGALWSLFVGYKVARYLWSPEVDTSKHKKEKGKTKAEEKTPKVKAKSIQKKSSKSNIQNIKQDSVIEKKEIEKSASQTDSSSSGDDTIFDIVNASDEAEDIVNESQDEALNSDLEQSRSSLTEETIPNLNSEPSENLIFIDVDVKGKHKVEDEYVKHFEAYNITIYISHIHQAAQNLKYSLEVDEEALIIPIRAFVEDDKNFEVVKKFNNDQALMIYVQKKVHNLLSTQKNEANEKEILIKPKHVTGKGKTKKLPVVALNREQEFYSAPKFVSQKKISGKQLEILQPIMAKCEGLSRYLETIQGLDKQSIDYEIKIKNIVAYIFDIYSAVINYGKSERSDSCVEKSKIHHFTFSAIRAGLRHFYYWPINYDHFNDQILNAAKRIASFNPNKNKFSFFDQWNSEETKMLGSLYQDIYRQIMPRKKNIPSYEEARKNIIEYKNQHEKLGENYSIDVITKCKSFLDDIIPMYQANSSSEELFTAIAVEFSILSDSLWQFPDIASDRYCAITAIGNKVAHDYYHLDEDTMLNALVEYENLRPTLLEKSSNHAAKCKFF
jgi:hypothetical protein